MNIFKCYRYSQTAKMQEEISEPVLGFNCYKTNIKKIK